MDPEAPTDNLMIEDPDPTSKDILESTSFLQSVIRSYFIAKGFEYPQEQGDDGYVVSDSFLRFHDFNMVEMARYHNMISLIETMKSIEIINSQFRSWLETTHIGHFQWLIDVYEKECVNIYVSCHGLQPDNLLSTITNEKEINDIRKSLLRVIEAYEKLQRIRTKQLTLHRHDNNEEYNSSDLRELDVNWRELAIAREKLPYFEMLDGQFVKVDV